MLLFDLEAGGRRFEGMTMDAPPMTADERKLTGACGLRPLAIGGLLLALYAVPVCLAAWFAVQTPFALIDDYTHSRMGEIWGSPAALIEQARGIIWPTEMLRYRWAYSIFDQGLTWRLFGNHPALHHLWRIGLRLACAALCVLLVERQRRSRWLLVGLIPLAFGLLHPIAPESRLGPQEPFLALCLLSCLAGIEPLFRASGERIAWSRSARAAFVIAGILLAGSKESALPVLWVLSGALVARQFSLGRWWLGTTFSIVATTAWTTVQVWRVSRASAYVRLLQSAAAREDSAERLLQFTLGWEIQPGWYPLLVMAGLGMVAIGIASQMRRPETRLWAAFQLLLVACCAAYLLPHARLFVASRYVMPAVWLLSILLAGGCDALLLVPVARRVAIAWLTLMLTWVPAANVSTFVSQFAIQAEARQCEAALRAGIADVGSSRLFLEGLGESDEENEFEVQLRIALAEFRPRFGLGAPILLQPLAALPDEWRHAEPGTRYLVLRHAGGAGGDEILAEQGAARLRLLKEWRPMRESPAARLQHRIVKTARRLRLHNSRMYRYTDAGAPPLDERALAEDLLYRWSLFEVTGRAPSSVP